MKQPHIPTHAVKSSNIAAIGHDEATNTLAVKFSSGHAYHYPGVSKAEAEALKGAKSIGSHFAQHIRPKFKGVKL
jgi:hypothetical protein